MSQVNDPLQTPVSVKKEEQTQVISSQTNNTNENIIPMTSQIPKQQQQPQQQVVMVPNVTNNLIDPSEIKDLLCPAAWSMVCCCVCGIPACFFEQASTEAYYIGDYSLAKRYQTYAKWLIVAACLCGPLVIIISLA